MRCPAADLPAPRDEVTTDAGTSIGFPAGMQAYGEDAVRNAAPPCVLVADDRVDVLTAIRLLLKAEGYAVVCVSSPEGVLSALSRQSFDVVLMDLNYTRDTTSGDEGLQLLARVREIDACVPIVAMTAWASVALAVDAMRTGVSDFIQKPWDNAQLLVSLRHQIQDGRARRLEQLARTAREDAHAQERAAMREIQRTLLPASLPSPHGTEVAAFWEPVGVVGGDFYDAAQLTGDLTWLCIGDVAGKGMSAALLMAGVQARVRATAVADVRPSTLCAAVNRELCLRMVGNRFVTFYYAVYDPARRRLSYANAGHNPPLLIRRCGDVQQLNEGGPVLGILSDAVYGEGHVTLESGDRLVMFTDGISEIRNASGVELGDDGVATVAVAHRHLGARELMTAIVSHVREFSGSRFEDDATVIVLAMD